MTGLPAVVADDAMSCATCHEQNAAGPSQNSKADSNSAVIARARNRVPDRDDGLREALRNAPSLVEVVTDHNHGLFHFDGEFSEIEALVAETFSGRNFGWLPEERTEARRHLAEVIRHDRGDEAAVETTGHFSYTQLFGGTDASLPFELRLPPAERFQADRASDDEINAAVAAAVSAYMRTLRFSRDTNAEHDGSSYDSFLAVNRLPRKNQPGETAALYARRLNETISSLRDPYYIKAAYPTGRVDFAFGPQELLGMRTFFREAIGANQKAGAGNCASCHVPPDFTDHTFHNTGVSQDAYDAQHGPGSFLKLILPNRPAPVREASDVRGDTGTARPSSGVRSGDFDWLQRPTHPSEDLGLWNIYANPSYPRPQDTLDHLLNPNGTKLREVILRDAVGRFKTPTVRDIDKTAPYLHTGNLASIEDVIRFYKSESSLAHQQKLRNPPPEFFGMRLGEEDVAPLVAFLHSLNDDYIKLSKFERSKHN